MRASLWIFLCLLLAGCVPGSGLIPAAGAPSATEQTAPVLSQEVPNLAVPDPQLVARAYLDAWRSRDYPTMYAWLTSLSQDAISEDDFVNLYRGLAGTMSLSTIEYELLSALTQSKTGQVAYQVRLESTLVGSIERETSMTLALEKDQWRVQWDRGLILPELSGGNALLMDYRTPARGNIYDKDGRALVAQADAVSLGLVAGRTDPDQEAELFHELWVMTGLRPEEIAEKLAAALDGWYVPLAEVDAERVEARFSYLSTFSGLIMEPYRSRYYFDGGVASQVLGYVSLIQPEEVEEYQSRGYRRDDRVGRMGLEKWAEGYLSGSHGGALYVITPDGEIITKLAESDPEPAQSVFTTLDKDLQMQVQSVLEPYLGAAVVMERDTGRILAMVSSPGFDPNLFEPTNFNSDYLLTELLTDPATPMLNRATQGQYPLGSVFKIVTLAAALESELYSAESTYYCAQTFNEIPGLTRYDWTYDYGVPASGMLTLPGGLVRSCNPWFWHIGLDFFSQGLDRMVAEMATGFGLGEATGIEQVVEASGQIPVPDNEIDAINLAIGQGDTLVTPLQVASFIAALGNGGDLLRPQIVERIEAPDGKVIYSFEPEVRRSLPVSQGSLAVIRSAMEDVVQNPSGTAYWRFINFPIPVAGKTGTAEAPPGDPHAWFAGYTYAEREDRTDVAVAVVLEHAGEGSQVAAPIWKRIVEIYYFGSPVTALPWETDSSLPLP